MEIDINSQRLAQKGVTGITRNTTALQQLVRRAADCVCVCVCGAPMHILTSETQSSLMILPKKIAS